MESKNINRLVFVGNLLDVEQKATSSGIKMSIIKVGNDLESFQFVCFKDIAAEVDLMDKGSVVAIDGKLRNSPRTTKDGRQYNTLDVQVVSIRSFGKTIQQVEKPIIQEQIKTTFDDEDMPF